MSDSAVYAVINNSDGFTNIRTAPHINARIVGKIDNYHVFSCDTNKTNWWKVIYIARDNSGKPNYIEGYIYKTKVFLLPEWKSIKPKFDKIKVRINTTAYLNKKHIFSKLDEDFYLIDGKRFWGTDGRKPYIAISSIQISIDKTPILIPKTAYNDLYKPSLRTLSFTYGPNNSIYIKMDNSDGAGAYAIIWIIKDDKYYGRYIDDSNV